LIDCIKINFSQIPSAADQCRHVLNIVNLPEIETKNLLFLLDYGNDGKKLLDSIFLVCAENETLKNILKQRNFMYSEYLTKTPNRENITKEQLRSVIGDNLFIKLDYYTKLSIDRNNHILESCDTAKNNISEFLCKEF